MSFAPTKIEYALIKFTKKISIFRMLVGNKKKLLCDNGHQIRGNLLLLVEVVVQYVPVVYPFLSAAVPQTGTCGRADDNL